MFLGKRDARREVYYGTSEAITKIECITKLYESKFKKKGLSNTYGSKLQKGNADSKLDHHGTY